VVNIQNKILTNPVSTLGHTLVLLVEALYYKLLVETLYYNLLVEALYYKLLVETLYYKLLVEALCYKLESRVFYSQW
jgi:hypothetical protein